MSAAISDIERDEVRFPSLAFFERLGDLMNEQTQKYDHLGWCDIRLLCAMVADEPLASDEYYGLAFDTFECVAVERVTAASPSEAMERFDADCVLEAYYSTWREMVETIAANGGADLTHTLNYLTLPDIPMRAWGPDQERADKFFRYNQTLQEFFNDACRLRVLTL